MPAQHNYRAYILEGLRVKSPQNLLIFVNCYVNRLYMRLIVGVKSCDFTSYVESIKNRYKSSNITDVSSSKRLRNLT